MRLPSKATRRIRETRGILKQYECSFVKYMTDNCKRRGDLDLGDIVKMGERECIICGWNGSCNYDVYFYDKDTISNVHPSDITKVQ